MRTTATKSNLHATLIELATAFAEDVLRTLCGSSLGALLGEDGSVRQVRRQRSSKGARARAGFAVQVDSAPADDGPVHERSDV